MEPNVSVIIPAYNEERYVARAVVSARSALTLMHRPHEIIVVDNNSSDRTAMVAARVGATVVFEPVNQISRARNAGARRATGRYLIFMDADTTMNARLAVRALRLLDSGQCAGGGSMVGFDRRLGFWGDLFVALWNALSPMMKMAAGCFLFCRRDAFAALGGFSEKMFAGEDSWFCWQLRMWGWRNGKSVAVITDAR